ncbi:MAG: RNA polymerase factor sigma-54 [Proteobacteria bacterium]|nr:RNA polymerase factor sigma-54 [Pseudomonadota bacterium]
MTIGPRLELRQGQSLVMTPQLQQAIKMLQLNNVELLEYVEQELSENPILEREDTADSPSADETTPVEQTTPQEGEDTGIDVTTSDDATMLDGGDLDVDSEDIWNAGNEAETDTTDFSDSSISWDLGGGNAGGGHDFDSIEYGIEQSVSQEVSLRDYLIDQIQIDMSDAVDRMIAVHLIDSLDDAGRVTESCETAAENLGCSVTRVELVLDKLQHLDPSGICARSLTECWAIQLRERGRLDPAMEAMLANVELLKQHDYPALAKRCGVDLDDIKDMVDEIWALNHRPAESFEHVISQPITPDVIMRSRPGGWSIELNNETLPRVLVNHQYYAEVRTAVRTKEEKNYLVDRMQSANWLVKALHQRATTILKVAEELVRQQEAFFSKGVEFLKPLVLRDIADAIEMHESTVSRVTSNKYMHTPRGIFELKYFFTPAISSSSGGESHSAEAVRHRIKTLINEESPKAVLSDDKMVELLNAEGIDIARRTVAKYRESLKIPSSVQRRRSKAMSF